MKLESLTEGWQIFCERWVEGKKELDRSDALAAESKEAARKGRRLQREAVGIWEGVTLEKYPKRVLKWSTLHDSAGNVWYHGCAVIISNDEKFEFTQRSNNEDRDGDRYETPGEISKGLT